MKTTKELARELGLLRRRTLSSTSSLNGRSGNGLSVQSFKYLIVIDFESTCWQDAKFRTQEIIEFPAVLLNTLSGEVESEFHYYVQPQEQPTLSSFCTELTGITQNQVDEGIPVDLCLRKFGHWLDRLYRDKGVVCQGTTTDNKLPVNTTCVTWSDWDLGVCLQYECKRKQLVKPAQLNSWIDLRATYRKFYDRKPNGLNGALQDLGIEFQGREHSGVDDARNTAKLAYRMIKDGCQMKVTKTLKTHERSASCNPTMQNFVAKATRITPPRKAKQKSSMELSTLSPTNKKINHESQKKTPSKIPVRIKTPVKSEYLKSRCSPTVCNGSAGSSKIENCDNESSEPRVKSCISQKRKHCTPVKEMGKTSVQSPRRKIQRKFSPKKFTAADIYVDTDSCCVPAKSPAKISDKNINKGLAIKDSNVQADRNIPCQGYLGKVNKAMETNDLKCFKVPNPVSLKQSEISVSDSLKMFVKTASDRSKKSHFLTSTSLHGQNNLHIFSQSKTSPVSIESINGRSYMQRHSETRNSVSLTPGTCHANSTGFRTPCVTLSLNSTNKHSGFSTDSSSMKVTPPLCRCGRRSRRRMVQSPGQNMGRFFFSCAVRKQVGSKEGCDFFKWETSCMNSQSSSASGSMISKQFTPVVKAGPQQTPGFSQKKSLGVRSLPQQGKSFR